LSTLATLSKLYFETLLRAVVKRPPPSVRTETPPIAAAARVIPLVEDKPPPPAPPPTPAPPDVPSDVPVGLAGQTRPFPRLPPDPGALARAVAARNDNKTLRLPAVIPAGARSAASDDEMSVESSELIVGSAVTPVDPRDALDAVPPVVETES